MDDRGTLTRLLEEWQAGDRSAEEELLRRVYEELRGLAKKHLRRSQPLTLLQTQALIHEAYVRLVEGPGLARLGNRTDFLRLVSRVMRNVVVDAYREKAAKRRGGGEIHVPLEDGDAAATWDPVEVLAIDEALRRLAAIDPRAAQVVEMRFFAGMTVEETAAVLGVDRSTILRDWAAARAWLARELRRGGE